MQRHVFRRPVYPAARHRLRGRKWFIGGATSALTAGSASLTSKGTTTANLSATDATGGTVPYTYQWKRKPSGGAYSNVGGATSLTLNDTGLSSGTTYVYKITYTDNVSATVDSNEVIVRTLDSVTDTKWYFSPFNWYSDGGGALGSNNVKASSTYTLSNNPGAYTKFKITTGSTVGDIVLKLDTTSLNTLTGSKCPTLLYRVYTSAAAAPAWSSYLTAYSASTVSLTLKSSASASTTYFVEVVFKSITLNSPGDRWVTPLQCVKITGLDAAADAVLATQTLRTKTAIFYGDSITEGAGAADGATDVNNADNDVTRTSWWLIAEAFDAEFGVIGYGGCGYIRGINNSVASSSTPCLKNATSANEFWDKYYSGQSRLVSTLLSPVPDYIWIHAGYNDAGLAAADVTAAIDALRTAAGTNCWIFGCSSNQGTNGNASTISTGVANAASTAKSKYIAPTQLFTVGTASPYSGDAGGGGAHSLLLGHATTGAEIVKQSQAFIGGGSSSVVASPLGGFVS